MSGLPKQDLLSNKWGKLLVIEDRGITVYCKSADHLYNFYNDRRDGTEPTRVRWSGFIMGRQSLRFDFEIPDWHELTDEGKVEVLDSLIQKEYDDDEIHGFHVEKIVYEIPDYSDLTDKELFALEHEAVEQRLMLEKKLHHTKLKAQAIDAELYKRDIDW